MARMKKAQAGLKASNKRVGPVDPNGAWTKVQEMNLPPRNVKTKVSLKKDKELGATKMPKARAGLRTGQYKRLGRIEARNPDRAQRVADRMIERDTRVQRGKALVAKKLMKPAEKPAEKPAMKKGGKLPKKKK